MGDKYERESHLRRLRGDRARVATTVPFVAGTKSKPQKANSILTRVPL